MHLSNAQILVWCMALAILEVQHLKWIVWEHWNCKKCGVKHRECGHMHRLLVWL